MSKADRRNGVPATVTSIPLVDPHAVTDESSIGDLVKEATVQVSTLLRAEVELAKTEITRDVKRGVAGSGFAIAAIVVLLYSSFIGFFLAVEILDVWLVRWAAFLIVFVVMLALAALLGFLAYLKVRRIRGPRMTIGTVQDARAMFSGGDRGAAARPVPEKTTDPSGW